MARILAIHAHPDDCEILAGGTLSLLSGAGHAVTIVTMTPGDCGSHEYGPEEISAIRRREAAAGAAILGAQYRCAEFRDLAIFSDDDARRRVVEILREVAPELILTSSPIDYMADHESTSMLVRDGCFAAPAPNYKTGGNARPLPAIPHLYFMDPDTGLDREGHPIIPDFVVDVASQMDIKKRALGAHESQRNWLAKHHGMDNYIEEMCRWTENCGRRAGLQYGEGFRRYKGHPYPQTALLEQLLGDRVRVLSPV